MQIDYANHTIEKQCTSIKTAKREFPEKVAFKLLKPVNFIEAAENLKSVENNRLYRFHDLKGDRNGTYALDIDGRRSSYRLLVEFKDVSKADVFANATKITIIGLKEVSKHYE